MHKLTTLIALSITLLLKGQTFENGISFGLDFNTAIAAQPLLEFENSTIQHQQTSFYFFSISGEITHRFHKSFEHSLALGISDLKYKGEFKNDPSVSVSGFSEYHQKQFYDRTNISLTYAFTYFPFSFGKMRLGLSPGIGINQRLIYKTDYVYPNRPVPATFFKYDDRMKPFYVNYSGYAVFQRKDNNIISTLQMGYFYAPANLDLGYHGLGLNLGVAYIL